MGWKNHHLKVKPVIMRDGITKEIVRRFESMSEAVKVMDIQHYRLMHAVRTGTEWEGYLWEFADKVESVGNQHDRP